MNGLPVFDNHDQRIKYYHLSLERSLENICTYELPPGYHFEFYQEGDRDAWMEIEKSAKEFTSYEQGLESWNRYYGGRESELPQRMVFVVTDSGDKVATATAFYDIAGPNEENVGWLHWVAVKREHQGKGIAKPMISYVLEIMKQLGYSWAKIPTQTTTWVACKIYLDFGFRPIPENVVESKIGWKIIKRLTSHPALQEFEVASDDEVLGNCVHIKSMPLLEYDADQEAVLAPDHEKLAIKLPATAVFAFLGDCIDEYARENQLEVIGEFGSMTKNYPIYLVKWDGREICLCQAPVGAAAAVQIMDWLIAYGVKYIISSGSCGVLVDIPENEFLVPARALRDEGTSYHYLAAERFVDTDEEMRKVIETCFNKKGLPYRECTTWTTDGFFRETKEKVRARKEEGCEVVEMECSALAACAKFRKVKFGQFFFTADSLGTIEKYEERGWGEESLKPALLLSLDIAADVAKKEWTQGLCF